MTWQRRSRRAVLFLLVLVALTVPAGCGQPSRNDDARAPDLDLPSDRAVVWAVGDGADGSGRARAVATMIADDDPHLFLYLGDVYPDGSRRSFARGFDPVYGRLAPVTAPTPGNHEWEKLERGYDPYWERVHGRPVPWYYAIRTAGWQLISVNTEARGAEARRQLAWLDRKLSAPGGDCRLVFMHRAPYSAGRYAGNRTAAALWSRVRGRVRIVLAGHDHNMQRMKPVSGTTLFVSGAGGHGLYDVDRRDRRLAFASDDSYGALRLELAPGRARHAFVALGGRELDAGAVRCSRTRRS